MIARTSRGVLFGVIKTIVVVLLAGGSVEAQEPPTAFVPPPRTIADITAILDQEKPDAERIAKMHSDADAAVPTGLGPAPLVAFLEQRARARRNLGRLPEATIDIEEAIKAGKGKVETASIARARLLLVGIHRDQGDHKGALNHAILLAREVDRPGSKGWLFSAFEITARILTALGDLDQADGYVRRVATLYAKSTSKGDFQIRGGNWKGHVEGARAVVLEAKGQFREAELAYRNAEIGRRQHMRRVESGAIDASSTSDLSGQADSVNALVANQGRMKAYQGRLSEAEADVRRALLGRLNATGKYAPGAPWYINQLALVLIEQGRYAESEQLLRASLEILRSLGVAEDSRQVASSLSKLARVVNLQHRYMEAGQIFSQLDATIKNWEPKRRAAFEVGATRIYQHYASGGVEAGIAAAEALLRRRVSRFGDKHIGTAMARGALAVGLARAGRDDDAIREFKAAVSLLLSATRENEQDDSEFAAAAHTRGVQGIVEEYIALVARLRPGEREAAETFRLADVVRANSVQRALAASSARLLTRDARLAELVRREQDLEKQANAQTGLLNNVLTLPPSERDEKVVRDLTAQIEKLRAARAAARKDLGRSFPSYADLVDPKPPSIEEVRAVLRPHEVLLSFYLGRRKSFVWAVPKEGPIGFAALKATSVDIERMVRKLRDALEPKAETIEDIPHFDIELAHELYLQLLRPVEESWRSAKSLIVVTNGALGLLPLVLLPTAPVSIAAQSTEALAAYRSVPWLARTHAVTSIPSAAALRTLRQLPPGARARDQFIGFGDPFFSIAQAEEAKAGSAKPIEVAEATTRGLPLRRRAAPQTLAVDSADLAQLPRLPDTAEELKSIARALSVDPAVALRLGKDAHEKNVKDADLTRFRIVAFATHGLVPGELNGLTQPALALTAPEVAGVDGDGLLTMEEVLALKLNADWVVLSACNTGTGAGAGAEAASGLGRAFFYAGARTLLLTNWSVHSASASELVTDIFRRQAAEPQLARAEALRQAMLALMDGPGSTDPTGNTQFSYAHPLFWGPYTIVGEGGVQ